MDATVGESIFIGIFLVAIVVFVVWKARDISARKRARDSIPQRSGSGDEAHPRRDSDIDTSQ